MSNSISVRQIKATDVEAVIALDRRVSGTSRRGFYEKRFAAAQANPKGFLWLVALRGETVTGFISAHILDGEFGGGAPSAVIDAVGTAPEVRGLGMGQALMAALEAEMRTRKVSELHSEANWTEQDLVAFFAKSGFELAPHVVLECSCEARADF